MACDRAYCSWKSAWIVPRIVKNTLAIHIFVPRNRDRIGRSTYPRLEYMIAKGIRTIHAHIFHISVIARYIVPRYADRYMRSPYIVPESFSDLRICD